MAAPELVPPYRAGVCTHTCALRRGVTHPVAVGKAPPGQELPRRSCWVTARPNDAMSSFAYAKQHHCCRVPREETLPPAPRDPLGCRHISHACTPHSARASMASLTAIILTSERAGSLIPTPPESLLLVSLPTSLCQRGTNPAPSFMLPHPSAAGGALYPPTATLPDKELAHPTKRFNPSSVLAASQLASQPPRLQTVGGMQGHGLEGFWGMSPGYPHMGTHLQGPAPTRCRSRGAKASLAMGPTTCRPKEVGRGPRCPGLEEATDRDAKLIKSWETWVHCPALQRVMW